MAWRIFLAVLALTVVAELFVSLKPHFELERYFAFNALYGFLACAALVLVARLIGLLIKRPDTYYDDE